MEAQEGTYGKFVLSVRPSHILSLCSSGTCLSLTSSFSCFRSMIIPSSSSSCTVEDGLYFWRPPLVLAEQGSYCSYPPYGVLGDDYMLDILNQTTRSRVTSSTSFSWPRISRHLSFTSFSCKRSRLDFPSPYQFCTRIFQALINHGNNHSISPDQQYLMFSEWLETDYIIAASQHLCPPSGSTTRRELCPMSHPGSTIGMVWKDRKASLENETYTFLPF